MKLYFVKPEYLYGDDRDVNRQLQVDMLQRLDLTESETLGGVVCPAEQALALISEGYCGRYCETKAVAVPIFEVKSEIDVAGMVETAIGASMEAVGKLFNDKTNSEQPGNLLLTVNDTLLMEDACTNELQGKLEEGWRIIAVCPQPQRRPDYILGRKKGL